MQGHRCRYLSKDRM